MGNIKLLDQTVASAISAGEVVERPFSVVKELIENSIDANATRIEVGIVDGGKKLIWVKDNGLGMDREDLEKCLLKHATSKISKIEDLYNIRSLGFRGEALYSISQVSELTIRSKTKSSPLGHELKTSFGNKIEIYETGTSDGTFVIVQNLFKNIPARKKFLKSSSWEKSLILEYIESIAILYPEIEIIFNDEGRNNLILKSTASREERIFQIFPELHKRLNTGQLTIGNYSAYAYISQPDIPMPNFNIFSVNKRFVKDRLFYKVLQDFYGEQRKKSPFVAIILEVPEYEVDVNVHPTKKEVRFQKTLEIYGFLRKLLEHTVLTKVFIGKEEKKMDKAPITISESSVSYLNESTHLFENNEKNQIPNFKIIGTFSDGYLLVEKEETLFIIDQHAAHERLLYNLIIEKFQQKSKESQKIIPYVITVNESKKLLYETYRKFLENLGYEFEDSGPMNIAITAIPSFLSYDTAIEIFLNLLREKEVYKKEEDFIKSIASVSACKEAIKKTTRLTYAEIEYILNALSNKNIETYCPHGRNFIIQLTLSEIEKKLGRKS